VKVHTERKIKRKWMGSGTVSIVTETEFKLSSTSFFERRKLEENSPSRSRINREGD